MRHLHSHPLLDLVGLTSSAAVFLGSLMLVGLDPEDRDLIPVLKVPS